MLKIYCIIFIVMLKSFSFILPFLFIFYLNTFAQTSSKSADSIAWKRIEKQPLNEKNFHAACDLMQAIAKTDIHYSYKIFQQYLPRVKATGNHQWVHVLLMGWARAKESLNFFAQADSLFNEARKNAVSSPVLYRESLVGTILLYLEWGKKDSLAKFIQLSEAACLKAGDKENLSFTYTFKAMAHLDNADTMGHYLAKAISLAENLTDKNALFTARYNHAVVCQNNPQKEVFELDTLLQLSNDSSLNHYPQKLYERTNFSFRNARPSIYYNLMQVNLLLTDYDNADKFARLFYDATITPHPDGVQAPYFNAEMAIVKAYHKEYAQAQEYLDKSRNQFAMPENKIPYISYFIAAGMLAEHQQHYEQALTYYDSALHRGNTEGLYLMPPEIYYAHALILTKDFKKAQKEFNSLQTRIEQNKYSAAGLYYYKYYADLLKAQNDHQGFANALEIFYSIKDSLTNLSRYRAIKEVETKFQVSQKQQQIASLEKESAIRMANNERDKKFYFLLISLAALSILLLALNIRHRKIRSRQKDSLQKIQIKQMEEQHRIDVMEGMIEAEEKERYKIADELHDEVGSMLSVVSLNISSTLENGMSATNSEKKLMRSQEILSSVSTAIRDLSHRLTPLTIKKYGFKKTVEDFTNSINLSGKLKVETIIIGFEKTEIFQQDFLNRLYRIISELLQNILKHADASNALLEVIEHDKHISIMVEDNGIGMDGKNILKGNGLDSIQSKIEFLHGRMEVTRGKENGTLVVIEIEKN